jgi:hypothetical protein
MRMNVGTICRAFMKRLHVRPSARICYTAPAPRIIQALNFYHMCVVIFS